jgi:hypothetical protein
MIRIDLANWPLTLGFGWRAWRDSNPRPAAQKVVPLVTAACLFQVSGHVSLSGSGRCSPRLAVSSGTYRARTDLPFTSWRRAAGRAARALLTATVTVRLGPLPSGALAALLAARTSRRFYRS